MHYIILYNILTSTDGTVRRMFLSSHLVWTSDYTHFGIICGRNNRCHTGGRPHIIFFLYNYRCLVKSFVTVYILRREVIWPSFLAENLLEAEIRPPNRNSDTFQYKIPTSTPHVPECPRVGRCRRIRRSRFKIHMLFGRTKWTTNRSSSSKYKTENKTRR